jgi:Tripartite tricarboxylate transporter family receptor
MRSKFTRVRVKSVGDLANLNLQYGPYRGTGPVLNDLVPGHIDIIIDQTLNSMQQIRAGTIRAYAVGDNKRRSGGARHSNLGKAGLESFGDGILHRNWDGDMNSVLSLLKTATVLSSFGQQFYEGR